MHMWVGKLWLGLMLVSPAQGHGGSSPHPARGLMSVCAYHMLAHARAHAARSAGMRMHVQSPLHPSAGLSTCLEVCADQPAQRAMHSLRATRCCARVSHTPFARSSTVRCTCTTCLGCISTSGR